MALGNWEKKNGKKKAQAATQRKKDSNARSAASGSQGKQSIEMSATTPSSVASSHSCLSNFLATNNVAVVNGIGPSLRATSQKHSVLTSEIGKNIVEDEFCFVHLFYRYQILGSAIFMMPARFVRRRVCFKG